MKILYHDSQRIRWSIENCFENKKHLRGRTGQSYTLIIKYLFKIHPPYPAEYRPPSKEQEGGVPPSLNQRVQGSNPCAPTNKFKDLAGNG